MDDISIIDAEVSGIYEEMVRLRRDFHAHPELGLKEKRTSGIIAEYLRGLGLEVETGMAKTGVVGLLAGESPGRTLMLRSDMDALPVQEKGDAPYRSMNKNVMHACGHDGHMANLLGTAAVLSRFRKGLKGQVKFVFQPAEEMPGGARLMVEEGVLENPKVDAAFGLHLVTALPLGYIGWTRGTMMAAMDTFNLRIRGKSGHSAMPEGSVDAILASARVISALQDLIIKDTTSPKAALVNVGTVNGGSAPNVVAEEVVLTGTVRTIDREVRAGFPAAMMRVMTEAAGDMKATFELDYEHGYPPVVNDPAMADFLADVIRKTPWGQGLIELPPVMGSEDMSFYLEKVPGCFIFLGAGNPERGLTAPLHSSSFDFDESALTIGATIFSRLALTFLG
jgi:amidohydrolase